MYICLTCRFVLSLITPIIFGGVQPPIQGVPVVLSPGVKRPGREADHSRAFNAEVKNAESCTSTPLILLRGVVLS